MKKFLLTMTTRTLLVAMCVALGVPSVVSAQPKKARKAGPAKIKGPVKVGKLPKIKKRSKAHILGRNIIKAYLTGTGPVAKKLKMKKSLNAQSALKQFNALSKAKRAHFQSHLRLAGINKAVKGFGAKNANDKRLGAALAKNLRGKKFDVALDRGLEALTPILPQGSYERLGKAAMAADRAAIAQSIAEIQAQIKGNEAKIKEIFEAGKVNADAWWYADVAVAVAAVAVVLVVVIDISFAPQTFDLIKNDKMVNNIATQFGRK